MRVPFLTAIYLITLSVLVGLFVGGTPVSAGTVDKTLSGVSQVHCDLFELVNLGPFFPEARAAVISGVSGASRTYVVSTGPVLAKEIGYTLAPSISNPVYEETELLFDLRQGNKIFDCSGVTVPDSSDEEDNQFYRDLVIDITARGDIQSIAYGSKADSHVLISHLARHDAGGVSGFTDWHDIQLKQNTIGSPTQTISVSGTGDGGDLPDSSIAVSGGGTAINATIEPFSLLLDSNGNVIAGPIAAIPNSCGAPLSYITGATGLSRNDNARHTGRLIEYGFFDGDNNLQTRVTPTNESTASGLLASTLSGSRPVFYYSVPDILIEQGICSEATPSWTTDTTVYACSPSIGGGDIATLQGQNPGSVIHTYYPRESGFMSFTFPTPAQWASARSASEGEMMDYVLHVPLDMLGCIDAPPGDGGGTIQPLSCVVEVESDPNPAAIGTSVVWTTRVINASGAITYTWSGTDELERTITKVTTSDVLTKSYQTIGEKNASVSVVNNGRTAQCTQVTPIIRPISASCTADFTETQVNNFVTWSASVVGGTAPFSYEWSGTDGLSGTLDEAQIQYTNIGQKTAQVVVTDSVGATQTVGCSVSVNITPAISNPEYDLNVVVNGSGTVTGPGISCGVGTINDCSETYAGDTEVALTQAPFDSSWSFTGWGGSLTGTLSPANLVMTGDKTVVANFAQRPGATTLDVTTPPCSAGDGHVTLSWTPSEGATGYLIERSEGNTSNYELIPGDQIELIALGTTVRATSPGTATAFFDQGLDSGTQYFYRITPINTQGLGPTSNGSATASVQCTLGCTISAANPSGVVTHSTTVSVSESGTATGTGTFDIDCGNGSFVEGNSGTCTYPTAGTYTVTGTVEKSGADTATCSTTVTANESGRTLSVEVLGAGSCAVSAPGISCTKSGGDCEQVYAFGSTQGVSVTPASGSRFTSWGGACSGSGTNDCNSILMNTNQHVTAQCDPIGAPAACTIDLKTRGSNQSQFANGSIIAFGEAITMQYGGTNLSGSLVFAGVPTVTGWTGIETASNTLKTKQLSGLTAARTYEFSVAGINSVGNSCVDTVNVGVKPQIPSSGFDLSTTCQSGEPIVTVVWNRSSLADTYAIEGTWNSAAQTLVSGFSDGCIGNSCAYVHSGSDVETGTRYTYRIQAANDNGTSPFTNSKSIVAATCPTSALPDLQVSSAAFDDAVELFFEDTNKINATITNEGSVRTPVSVWSDSVEFQFPDNATQRSTTERTASLGSLGTYSFSSDNVTFSQLGIYNITVCTDVNNQVPESNENNNCRLLQFSPPTEIATTTTVIPTCVQLGNCPPEPTILPPVACELRADPSTALTGNLVTYTATVSGGDGTYTYDWRHSNGNHWGDDVTTTLTTQSKSTTYSSAGDKRVTLNVTSRVGDSRTPTTSTVDCTATHVAGNPAVNDLVLTHERECRTDGTILIDRVRLDGWVGSSQAKWSRFTRSGGNDHPLHPQAVVWECNTGSDCEITDSTIEPGNTYTYNARKYSNLQAALWSTPEPNTLIIDIGTESITIPPNNCPVIPEPTCRVSTAQATTNETVYFSIDDLTYTPNQVYWGCGADGGTLESFSTGHSRSFSTAGTKTCSFTIQDGANRWSNDTCTVEVKEDFECYATVNGQRVTQVEVGTPVQWKHDINKVPYNTESFSKNEAIWPNGGYGWRNWELVGGVSTDTVEGYRIGLAKRVNWNWANMTWYLYFADNTNEFFQSFSTSGTNGDFVVTYTTPGTKTVKSTHNVNDGSGRINARYNQIDTCSVEVVDAVPLQHTCGIASNDATVTVYPGPPTSPGASDYQVFFNGTITEGSASVNDQTYLWEYDEDGDGTAEVSLTKTGAEIIAGTGLAQTFDTVGSKTPFTRITNMSNGKESSWTLCPVVAVNDQCAYDFDFGTPGNITLTQGEATLRAVNVENTSTCNADSESTTIEIDVTNAQPGLTVAPASASCTPTGTPNTCSTTFLFRAASDATLGTRTLQTEGRTTLITNKTPKDFQVTINAQPDPDVDLSIDGKLEGVKGGVVRFPAGSFAASAFLSQASSGLLKWETSNTSGTVTCTAEQERTSDSFVYGLFNGSVAPSGTLQLDPMSQETEFVITCRDENITVDTFDDHLTVQIFTNPTFEEF